MRLRTSLIMPLSVFCLGEICRATVDQSFTGSTLVCSALVRAGNQVLGQTFVAKLSGALTAVDVDVNRGNLDDGGDLVLTIETVAAGFPTGTVLASASVPVSSLPQNPGSLTTMSLSSSAKLTADEIYAIVLTTSSNGNDAGWAGACPLTPTDLYPPGAGLRIIGGTGPWTNFSSTRNWDFHFQTFLKPNAVPAVSEWGIASLGLLLLAGLSIKFRGALPKRA